MRIEVKDAGKRFNREWIFRHLSHSFELGKAYAVTGPNGSGKSTLLQVLAGAMMTSEGSVQYFPSDKNVPEDIEHMNRSIAIAAPYLDLIEEMTAEEFLHFHAKFKPLTKSSSLQEILAEVGLGSATKKQIRLFSSGMKQRLKLAQAFFTEVPVLFLDEPCTNLDKEGIDLYQKLISRFVAKKLVIVCSNDLQEYSFCETVLNITDFK